MNEFFDRAFQGGDDAADLRRPGIGRNRDFHVLIGFARMKKPPGAGGFSDNIKQRKIC
jgi:hypothetical protein